MRLDKFTISLWCKAIKKNNSKTSSGPTGNGNPSMNDPSKIAPQFPEGIITPLHCPVCKEILPKIAPCSCTDGACFQAIFLTRQTTHDDSIGICNVHGCHSSFLKDSGNIVSEVKVNIRMEI